MLYGIDISKWQGTTPDFDGLDFVVLRASIGTDKDVRYDQHYAAARKAGIAVGAYHFNWDTISVAEQAAKFLEVAKDADFLALDLEGQYEFSGDQARAFISLVHRAGRKIGVYHSLSGYPKDLGQDWRWVAYWSEKEPSIQWDMWQYRGSPLDLNKFDGGLSDLYALGDTVATAVNGGSRVMSSDYTRSVKKGTIAYSDTNGTRLTTVSKDVVLDDFGLPIGAYGWCYLRISSGRFDADSEQENGLALFKVGDVGPLVMKEPVDLKSTAERYFVQPAAECPPDTNGAYNDGLKAAQDAVLAVKPMG
jgi:hypothetical protein